MTEELAMLEGMAQSVEEGRLRLETGAAEKCVAACTELLVALELAHDRFRSGDWRARFGDFEAGIQLADRYEQLATGTDTSFDRVLQGHIDVVVRMREVFEAAGRAYREAEASNVGAFGALGDSLGG